MELTLAIITKSPVAIFILTICGCSETSSAKSRCITLKTNEGCSPPVCLLSSKCSSMLRKRPLARSAASSGRELRYAVKSLRNRAVVAGGGLTFSITFVQKLGIMQSMFALLWQKSFMDSLAFEGPCQGRTRLVMEGRKDPCNKIGTQQPSLSVELTAAIGGAADSRNV